MARKALLLLAWLTAIFPMAACTRPCDANDARAIKDLDHDDELLQRCPALITRSNVMTATGIAAVCDDLPCIHFLRTMKLKLPECEVDGFPVRDAFELGLQMCEAGAVDAIAPSLALLNGTLIVEDNRVTKDKDRPRTRFLRAVSWGM